MELELVFESRSPALPVDEMLHQILNSQEGLAQHLRSAGLQVKDVSIEPPAEFPKGAKKLLVRITIAFLLGAAGEGGKVTTDQALHYYQQQFPNASIDIKAPPPQLRLHRIRILQSDSSQPLPGSPPS